MDGLGLGLNGGQNFDFKLICPVSMHSSRNKQFVRVAGDAFLNLHVGCALTCQALTRFTDRRSLPRCGSPFE